MLDLMVAVFGLIQVQVQAGRISPRRRTLSVTRLGEHAA